MRLIKCVSIGLFLCCMSSLSFADTASWTPHVTINQPYGFAGIAFPVSGGGNMSVINDTDQTHYYNYSLEVSSTCGETYDRNGHYRNAGVVIPPHATWRDTREVKGYIKCNEPGNKVVTLIWKMVPKNGGTAVDHRFDGFVVVVPH